MSLKILHIDNQCTGCGACVSACPQAALSLQEDKLGFYYPTLDKAKCIACRLCEKTCHAINFRQPGEPNHNFKPLMLKAKNRDIVMKSSSGGVFSLLANQTMQGGGIAYGAKYDYEQQRLIHTSTDECDIDALRKSKYIESYTGNIFSQVYQQLEEKRDVMFVGAPCQIEGLIRFLDIKHADTSKLLLVRFVCHGIPSNSFFRQYMAYEEKRHRSKMTGFDFRPKFNGWGAPTWYMKFENGDEIKNLSYYYYYHRAFYDNISLRKCCYNCTRVLNDKADITIADFWGLKKYRPAYNDKEGVSLVLIHSGKGAKAIESIADESIMEDIPVSSMEYIYAEAKQRDKHKAAALCLQNKVAEHDGHYMPFVIKIYRNSIIKLMVKKYLYSKLRPLIRWVKR